MRSAHRVVGHRFTGMKRPGSIGVRIATAGLPRGERAPRLSRATRPRSCDVEGPDEHRVSPGTAHAGCPVDSRPGEARPAAALTPKGEAPLPGATGWASRRRAAARAAPVRARAALAHLKKFVDLPEGRRSPTGRDEVVRLGLVRAWRRRTFSARSGGRRTRLPRRESSAAEILVAGEQRPRRRRAPRARRIRSSSSSENRRGPAHRGGASAVRTGRGLRRTSPTKLGLDSAISTTKGCYVGQEIVARMRTYGRVNRRLVGFRFSGGAIAPGTLLKRPEEPEPGKVEQGTGDEPRASPRLSDRSGSGSPSAMPVAIGASPRSRRSPRSPRSSRPPLRSSDDRRRFPGAPTRSWRVHLALLAAQTGFALFPTLGKLALDERSRRCRSACRCGRQRRAAARGCPASCRGGEARVRRPQQRSSSTGSSASRSTRCSSSSGCR